MLTEGEELGISLAIVAIILAIVIPFFIERSKKPHLIVQIDEDILIPGQPTRYLHGRVINQPHLDILSAIERHPAYDTRVVLRFYAENQTILGLIEAKWTQSPECRTPITQIVINQSPGQVDIRNIDAFDPTKTVFSNRRTIPTNTQGEPFDIVVKNQGQNDCFAVTGWSYRFRDLADPDLAIHNGIFTLEIEAISTNARSQIQTFRLRNEGPDIRDVELHGVDL